MQFAFPVKVFIFSSLNQIIAKPAYLQQMIQTIPDIFSEHSLHKNLQSHSNQVTSNSYTPRQRKGAPGMTGWGGYLLLFI
jgi:hypothetical protein